MSITGAYVMPHPPLIIPEVGRGEEKKISKTVAACEAVAGRIAEEAPDTVVLTSPHAQSFWDCFHINPQTEARGDMRRFGAGGVNVSAGCDTEFIGELSRMAGERDFPVDSGTRSGTEIDHAATVPLYFINKAYTGYRLVLTGISGMPPESHYEFGRLIAETARVLDRKTVFLASGDLSHRLLNEGPYGFAKEGPAFDEKVTEALANADFETLMNMDPGFCENAGECGLRALQVMAGTLDGMALQPEMLSYEGPFGVGYCVAAFSVTGRDDRRKFFD